MKKRYTRIISFVMSVIILTASEGQPVFAEKKDQLQQDAATNQKKLNEAESEAESLETEKGMAEEELEAAQEQLVNLIASVAILEGDIERKKEEIAQAEIDYEEAKREEERQYNTMRARIKYMYENGTTSSTEYIDILLNAESLTDALNKAAYAEKLAEYDRNMLNKFIKAKEDEAERKKALEDDLSELEEVQIDLEHSREDLNATIEEQQATIENFSSKLAAAKSEAKAYQKKIEEDNAEIARIVAAEKEAARKKAEEEARKKKEAEEAAKKAAQEASKTKQVTENPAEETGKAEEKTTNSEKENVNTSKQETEERQEEKQEEVEVEVEEEEQEEQEENHTSSSSSGGGRGAEIASYAQNFIGNPYVAGGTSLTDGCDCSGFTQAVYSHFGYSLPRRSDDQGHYGSAVDGMENAQPGDIFYYVGHVGIYIGNGYIVHASTPSSGIKITPATYRSVASIRRIV